LTLSIRQLLRVDAVLARWPIIRLAHAKARAFGHRRLLPPGRIDASERWRTDQMFFAKQAASLGPIFKMIFHGRYATCLVGHKRARELLNAQENALQGCDIDLRNLFPKGSIRVMSGDDHQKYRRIFMQALQATPLASHDDAIRGWIRSRLATLAKDYSETPVPGPELRLCLRDMTTGIMLRILFGLAPDDPQFPAIIRNYRTFGPITSELAPEQVEAFFEIRDQVRGFAGTIRRDGDSCPPSLLKAMVERNELDETALGNLIFTFERSHFDLFSLWRWIVKHLVSNPDFTKKIQNAAGSARTRLCEAAVLESLRLEQVEYLHRTATSDISHQHYLIPKNTLLRVCLWEGHKDPKVFPDPLKFDPERFVGRTYTIEEYAPFGLDKKRCVASDLVVTLSTMFVETLLEQCVVTSASDGPPEFGAHHWEPNRDFSVVVSRVQ